MIPNVVCRLPRALVIALAAVAVASAACKRDREIDGVAGWSLERTTLADAQGICSPYGELTWCYRNPGLSLGEQRASVDLYFRGDDDDAPLVEILLAINACRPAEVEGVLSSQLGDPAMRRDSVLRWDGAYAITFAQLESKGGSCEINIVSPDDDDRIAELSAGAKRSGHDENEDDGATDAEGAGGEGDAVQRDDGGPEGGENDSAGGR